LNVEDTELSILRNTWLETGQKFLIVKNWRHVKREGF